MRFIAPVSISILLVVLGGAVALSSLENSRIEHDLAATVDDHVAGLKQILGVTDAIVMEQVRGSMHLLQERSQGLGEPSLAGQVAVKDKTVPNLLLGKRAQAGNYELVDGVTKLLGGTATLFVKSGDEFVRVSTNVKRNNDRAVGTVLDPKGKAIAAIREDKPFYGVVDILGNPFLTGYEPMHDAQGQVIGIWYVGYKADMAAIKQIVERTRLLTSGFLAVIDGNGKVRYRSSHVDDERVAVILKDATGWVVKQEDYPGWNFKIIAAYPKTEAAEIGHARMWAILGLGVVTSAALIVLMYLMLRRLVLKPLGGEPTVASAAARRIAAGDLTGTIALAPGDTDSVMAAMEQMRRGLSGIVSQIQDGVVELNSASDRLANTATYVAEGVDRQNEATTSIAATLEELSASIRNISENTEHALNLVTHADSLSASGNAAVGDAVTDMQNSAATVDHSVSSIEKLAEESQRISVIVDVIRDIAEQTNLLALNAAIEAARAGESGRGFAVVADEVRKLAERTAASTGEIAAMVDDIRASVGSAIAGIEDGSRHVNSSVEKAGAASETMVQIQHATTTVADSFGEISCALREQSTASELISSHVGQVSEMNEENALAVQHVVESSNHLKNLSERLSAAVENFRVQPAAG